MRKKNKTTEDLLLGAMRKLEHRIEILLTISNIQENSGHYDLAKSYKDQAQKLREDAKSLGKILNLS